MRMCERLSAALRGFASDPRGNSAANVIFLMLLIGFGGLAADVGNLYRMKNMMQATADSAVLAAAQQVMDEPDTADDVAMYFVETNMPAASYGSLTTAAEVRVGQWDEDLQTINVGATPPNAVGVILERNAQRANPLATIMFWITGQESFDLSTGAVAVFNGRECASADGMIANGQVHFRSVNRFSDNFCVYGRQGVEANNGNDFTGLPLGGDGTGALLGTGLYAKDHYGCLGIDLRGAGNDPCDFSGNPGMEEALFHSDKVRPHRLTDYNFAAVMAAYKQILEASNAAQLAAAIAAAPFPVDPADVYAENEWQDPGKKFKATLLQSMETPQDDYRTYYFQCNNDRSTLTISSEGDFRNMTIVTNCQIQINGSASNDPSQHTTWKNVTIATVSSGKFDNTTDPPQKGVNFEITGGNQFGDGCGPENSVSFMSTGSIEFAGNNRYRGVEITAANDLIMAGNQSSYVGDIGSFSAHVGGDIYFTSTSDFVACDLGPEKVVVEAKAALVY